MIDSIRECRRIYESLRRQISKLQVEQVQSTPVRESVQSTVDGYFRTDRPLLSNYYDTKAFVDLDQLIRQLLGLSQHRSLRTRYLSVLRAIVREFDQLELHLLPQTPDKIGLRLDEHTEALCSKLDRVSAAAARCYRQGVNDLNDDQRASWRGTATEFREALREVLDLLASDDEVQNSVGYKPEPGTRRPTMRQKARFILSSRKAKSNSVDTVASLADTVDERFGGFVRNVYSSSSGSVHCHSGKEEVTALKRYVDLALHDLLGGLSDEIAA